MPVKQVYTERYSCLTPYRSDARGVAALVIGLNTKTESTAARHAPGATDQEEERKYAVVYPRGAVVDVDDDGGGNNGIYYF